MTTLEPGTILVSKWGYDQTNAEFWRVEQVTPKGSAKLMRLATVETSDGPQTMTGKAIPGEPTGETIRRKVNPGYDGQPFVQVDYRQFARPWAGNPVAVSHYA